MGSKEAAALVTTVLAFGLVLSPDFPDDPLGA